MDAIKGDAIKGIKHFKDEVLKDEVVLGPLQRWALPITPKALNAEIMNSTSGDTYIIRIYRVEESVRLPKVRK